MRALLLLCRALTQGWTWKMAWRESRRSRQRLLLYAMSIVLGVAALIAVGSLGEDLRRAVETQAKTLLGADLAVQSNSGFSDEESEFLRSLGGVQARESTFSSMVAFPRTGGTRFVQVRALEGDFPFYGTLETIPPSAAVEFRRDRLALVDENLTKQFALNPGDELTLGAVNFRIAGILRKVPGEVAAFGSFAPRVYVPMAALADTELLQKGSLVRHKAYFKFGSEVDVAQLVKKIRPTVEKFHLEVDTVEHRKRELGRAMTNLYHFLNLVGFVALLLGGVGVASAIQVHVKEKLGTVAVLRSLGCTSAQALAIYLAQGIALGCIGVAVGAALGLAIQLTLPAVLADFLPVRFASSVSWVALGRGAAVGLSTCLVFALLPLLTVRRIPPLAAFRSGFESWKQPPDPLRWACYAVIVGGLVWFSISQSRDWKHGLGVAAAVGASFAVLAIVARVLMRVMKRQFSRFGPFVWRQGVASLYRPQNRTFLVMLSLGLGTFLVLALYLVQSNLTSQLIPGAQQRRADTVLFDVQVDQVDEVKALLNQQSLPVLQDVPIVTMRLAEVKGRPVEAIRKDPRRAIPHWALRREYRSTYRAQLEDSEQLISGVWHERVEEETSPVPVSVEEGIARTLNVGLGDELVFDVQGVPVRTMVANLREVDWRRLQPNFFVVFPLGVLEQAPAFRVLVTQVGSPEKSAELQRQVVQKFPNVSLLDLRMVLQTVEGILSKISSVIRFMALFTVGTGVVVLIASLLSGRYQRLQESVLLRTLGASRGQIRRILMVEYLCLGGMAALTGVILAVAGAWALAAFVFKIPFSISFLPVVVTLLTVMALTVLAGLLTSGGIYNRPPLEVLRNEV
jgi:putative ABC transport system permease protein